VSSFYKIVQGGLIAGLWLVAAVRREIRYRRVVLAVLLVCLAATVVLTTKPSKGDRENLLADEEGLLAILLVAPLVLLTVMMHEIGHGWVALQLGDPTAKDQGRLSLFPITTFFLFNVTLAMPKPVPITPRNFENPRKGIMWVGLAGPAVNIFFMLFFAMILTSGVIPTAGAGLVIREVLMLLVIVNMILAMFNLIPIPPLDGSRLLIGLLPPREAFFLVRVQRLGLALIFAVVIWAQMSIGMARVVLPPVKFVWGLLGLDVGELQKMAVE
jgi:Zn-dependent protease